MQSVQLRAGAAPREAVRRVQRRSPPGVATGGFLQGSFARKTMLPPLHDVDKIIILGGGYTTATNPDSVMDDIEGAINRAYPVVTFDRSRHAVKIDIEDDPFMFDSVPAF